MEENILKKIGDGIVNIAPSIGSVLTATGVGAPAGLAINALAALGKAFGLGSDSTATEIATKMLSDPEARLKVAMADRDFALKQRDQDLRELEIRLADVNNARKLDSDKKDTINRNLAYTIVGGFIALIASTLLGWAKVDSALAGTLVGYLSAKCEQVLAYYFGSSKSSDKKTDLLAKAESIK